MASLHLLMGTNSQRGRMEKGTDRGVTGPSARIQVWHLEVIPLPLMLVFVFVVLIKVIFRERDVLFVQLMNPTILCGQMEMQAFQLAYVSISLCLFPSVENSLPRQKRLVASYQIELLNFFYSTIIDWNQFKQNRLLYAFGITKSNFKYHQLNIRRSHD